MPTQAEPQQVPATQTQTPETQAPEQQTQADIPASAWGLLEDGRFKARLGAGLTLAADVLESGEIDLSTTRALLPGVALKTAVFRNNRLDIAADVAVPGLDTTELNIRVSRDGTASIRGRASRQLDIAALGHPEITLSLDETGSVNGQVAIDGADLAPAIAGMTAEGGGTLTLSDGKIGGDGHVRLVYRDLGHGTVDFAFDDTGRFTAGGVLKVTPPFADEITADIAADSAGNLKAAATVTASALSTPIPGLAMTGGTLSIGYENGDPSFAITDFTATYRNLGTVALSTASLGNDRRLAGRGDFVLILPAIEPVVGTLALADGAISGSVTLTASDFPDGLPITSGSITGVLGENGAIDFSGTVGVDLGPAGSGTLSASYGEAGDLSIGAEVDLTVPGLEGGKVQLTYANGDIEGEALVPIDTVALPGLGGAVTVRFAEGRWSGETEIAYSADNGKLSGNIRVTLAQTEDNGLQVGGGGSVTAQLMPKLEGTLEATILPGGGIDISGAIEVTEPLELFPEKRLDKELFKYSQSIPLWAMLVAVIRVRAGIRAGIGPGVFRNIRVEGSYTIGADEADPTFSISGEMYIPAFAEAYVAFGAGLGLDVLLGSLTGGIEGVATAGVYGAISVVPELNYADGDWSIEGVATMAAGARLTLGLNAWAEIEALFVTVWEREWKLAEHVMSVGPDLALQAKMSYVFGSGEAPELEMTTSDIDTDSLIQDAMPKDGPGPSGAREALQNKAEWKGALKEKREAPLPPEAENAGKPGRPPEPARPQRRNGPPPRQQDPGDAAPTDVDRLNADILEAGNTDDKVPSAVPEEEAASTQTTRYPGPITLAMLEEAPAPMPRTQAQEREDLAAARQAVKVASRAAADSDALDNFFPAIKKRFGLRSLGYEGDFQKGFRIVGKINPEFSDYQAEPLKSLGLPEKVATAHQTDIDYEAGKVNGEDVSIGMRAYPLGPDHPLGSVPADAQQKTLMKMMPTGAANFPGKENRFIKGHLLNHRIGGPGTEENMFPITDKANQNHNNSIERDVVRWINDERYWVAYTVEIKQKKWKKTTAKDPKDGSDLYSINATMHARASVLDLGLNPIPKLTKDVTIHSVYQSPTPATEVKSVADNFDPDEFDKIDVRDEDAVGTHDVRVPVENVREGVLYGYALMGMKTKIRTHTRAGVRQRLLNIEGVGPKSVDTLFKAYDKAKRGPGGDTPIEGLEPAEKAALTFLQGTQDKWDDIMDKY